MNKLVQIMIIAFAAAFACASWADVVHLKNGNSMEGEIIRETDEEVKLKTPTGSITFKMADIERVERKISPLQLYEREAARLEDDDSAGHYVLGLWSKKKGLRKQATLEFLKTIAANPDHAEARKELGHVMHGGKWATKEEAMKAKGFVKYKGRWLTRQEAEELRRAGEENKWRQKLMQAARKMCGSKPEDGRKVFEAISLGDDPRVVVPALRSVSRHRCAPARTEVVKALARLRTPRAFDALIEAVLNENDVKVQELIVAELKAINSKRAAKLLAQASRDLRKSLKTARNERKPDIVRAIARASTAMGMLGEQMAVPELAESLVLTMNYIQKIDATRNVSGPMDASMKSAGPVTYWNGRISLPTTSGVTINGSVNDTKVIPKYFNEDAATALRRLTGERHDFDRRRWLAWWAMHKPVFPPEAHEFELN